MRDEDTPSPEAYLDECLQIIPEVLEEEFIRLPADMAYWSRRYADAYRSWLEAKITRDRELNVLFREARIDLEIARDSGRVTVKEVEAAVVASDRHHELQMAVADAEAEKVYLGGVLETIRTKRDMIISLGAHIRAEMERDPIIRER